MVRKTFTRKTSSFLYNTIVPVSGRFFLALFGYTTQFPGKDGMLLSHTVSLIKTSSLSAQVTTIRLRHRKSQHYRVFPMSFSTASNIFAVRRLPS